MAKLLIANGPNLNMLGQREPEIYGSVTLAEIETRCRELGRTRNIAIEFIQSNHEGELIDAIQNAGLKGYIGIVINPAGFSHSSVAIADALRAADIKVIEVHLSNIHKRETFRHHSFVSKVADGIICGLGADGYELAIKALASSAASIDP
ncbi:MAG: type II 3-dehydroquinate dehydratase [Rhodobacteraceae bacterium]|nr:type II 3-dehydroquinate dehydratase [Paracoccaceae bacterium]MCY4195961.1 type II 3-dehydroquinate dehydratase [Paracoccaceae bacterium]